MKDLANKYRPQTFDEMVGQDAAVDSVKDALAKKRNRVFLLVGFTGAGKTTLAEIIAREVGCDPEDDPDFLDYNAANTNGVDDIRDITDKLQYIPRRKARVVHIDEAHGLTKQAWTALLKPVERPPKGNYFIFSTTEAAKVPANIRGRCCVVNLERVGESTLTKYLATINKKEKVTALGDETLAYIAKKSGGSVRTALNMLSSIGGCKTTDAAKKVIGEIEPDFEDKSNPIIQLCQALVRGVPSWPEMMKIVAPLRDGDPETTRRTVLAYMTSVLLNASNDKSIKQCLAVIQAFNTPTYGTTGLAPTLLSLGELAYSG